MADVEDEIQVIRDDGYKVYKRRWLVLLAATSFAISAGFYRARVPVVHIVYEHWGTSVYQVASWSFVALVMNAITLLPFGRMLDYYGIRRTVGDAKSYENSTLSATSLKHYTKILHVFVDNSDVFGQLIVTLVPFDVCSHLVRRRNHIFGAQKVSIRHIYLG